MYIETHLGDVLLFPEVAFAFFLVTNRDATAFAVGDFVEPRATKLIITKPSIAYRNNAKGLDKVRETWPFKWKHMKELNSQTQKTAASNKPSFQ